MTVEEKAKRKAHEKIFEYMLTGATFSVSFTLIAAIYFNNIVVFYGFIISLVMYATAWLNYYLSKYNVIKSKFSTLINLYVLLFGLALLTYLAGGFSGSMISAYFMAIIAGAMLLNRTEATQQAIVAIFIYLFFLFGETFNIITPIVTDFNIISYSKAIIDILTFIVITLLISIITKNTEDSIKFYKLRSVRLSKIRERLEFLVKRRTKELEKSNKIIRERTKEVEKANKDLKKAQNKIRRSYRELKKLDVEKDEFISVAAHELKTPLTIIGGYAQLLKTGKIKNSKKQKRFLDILDKESKRLSLLVSEMLDISRIDLGAVHYNIEEIDIYKFMKNIRYQFSPKIKQKKLKCDFNLQKNLPKIEIDKHKLHQIMTNLLSNALKYTPKGKIVVKLRKVKNYLEFSVADTGIGIPKKYHKKIFERFFKIDSPLKEVESTGLGLSIVKEYIRDFGGKLWFKSRVDKGTTFYFKLPIKTKLKEDAKIKFLYKKKK